MTSTYARTPSALPIVTPAQLIGRSRSDSYISLP